MTDAPNGAQRASRPTHVATRRSLIRRIAFAAGLSVAIVIPATIDAAPVLAASTCTGWNDKVNPPKTVRVLRTKSVTPGVNGTVQTVDFRRYVGTVMADEWPSFYPAETLKAAATAVKQYAWYHAMVHRSRYVTASGACYDVKDSTIDQLFRPEIRSAKPEHLAAIAATWGLSVRKSGRFFLTGYRSGRSDTCGADADGYRLYAHSAYDCGRRGLSRQQIQRRYYGSDLTEVWSSATVAAAPRAGVTSTRVTTSLAPLRTRPSIGALRIATLPRGARLAVLGSARDGRGVLWHKVKTMTGRIGWVSSRLTRAV